MAGLDLKCERAERAYSCLRAPLRAGPVLPLASASFDEVFSERVRWIGDTDSVKEIEVIRRNPENGMEENGETSATPAELRWKGVGVRVLHREWTTETGCHTLVSDKPTLYVILDEVGGRCELRASAAPVTMNYCGPQALGFAPARTSLFAYPSRLREAQIASFSFYLDEIKEFSPTLGSRIERASLRPMFDDSRLRDCAVLLAAEYEKSENSSKYGEGLALSLLAALAEIMSRPLTNRRRRLSHHELMRATEYIEEQSNRPLRVDEIARVVSLEMTKFSSLFRQATGMSMQRWQVRVRVHQAQRMMLDGPNQHLSEIADLLGFADQSHFARAFKQFTGSTPREWLRSRS
jgi:AraC family transcriptional regulator